MNKLIRIIHNLRKRNKAFKIKKELLDIINIEVEDSNFKYTDEVINKDKLLGDLWSSVIKLNERYE